MDSVFNYVHWEKSSIPVLADLWIHDKPPQEFVIIPEEFDFEAISQLDLKKIGNFEKAEKTEWRPNPMET